MVVHEQLQTLVELFVGAVLADPLLSPLALALGALFVGVASGIFGYLTLRGVLAWFSGSPGQGPPRQAR
jgi:hypothetical protein